MRRHEAQAGKIDWRWWALQSHFSLSHSDACSHPPVPLLRQNAPDLLSWTNASFMTLLLFYHGNSFESIYQSAGTIRHVDLKDQVQVIPSIHWGGPRWKGKKGVGKKIPLPLPQVAQSAIKDSVQKTWRKISNRCLIVSFYAKTHHKTLLRVSLARVGPCKL